MHLQVLIKYEEQSQAKCALRFFEKNVFLEELLQYFASNGPPNISLHLSSNKAAERNKMV